MTSYVVSTLLMGVLAALVVVALLRSRHWYTYSPEAGTELATAPGESRPPVLSRPTTWIAGFVLLAALAVGGVFVFVTTPDAPAGLFSLPVLAVGGLMLVAYLLLGTYYAAKGRGHSSSIAAAESATLFGVLLLLAVATQLIG